MPRTKDQQRGVEFEKYVARILDGKLQPGSGNKFYAQGDVSAHGMLVSAKSQTKFRWKEIVDYFDENRQQSYGTGNIPVLALEDVEHLRRFALVELDDLPRVIGEEVTPVPQTESKGAQKRKAANIPVLLRD